MEKLLSKMLRALEGGETVVLCTVLAASGSVPRGAGAKMAVFADGSIAGTIGGGSVEYAAIRRAMEVHATGEADAQSYVLRPNEVRDLGMVCGGEVTVYFLRFEPETAVPLLHHLLALSRENRNSWLIMAIRDSHVVDVGTWDEEMGAKFLNHTEESDILPLLGRRPVYREGELSLFVEPLSRRGTVYIFGGGHVGAALCPVLAGVGFRVTVVENRPGLCDPARFPGAAQILRHDCADIRDIPITADDYCAIMTPGHANDLGVLDQVLRTPARYIGLIGSRKKLAATREFLLDRGHTPENIGRIHAPIGLAIGAETPQEIAISIAAELIAERAGR